MAWSTIDRWEGINYDDLDEHEYIEITEHCPPLTTIRRDPQLDTWSVLPDFDAVQHSINDGECAVINERSRHGKPLTLDDIDPDDTPLAACVNDHGNTTLKLHLPASRVVPGSGEDVNFKRYPFLSLLHEAEISFYAPSPPCPGRPIEHPCENNGHSQQRALRAIQRALGVEGIIDHLTPREFTQSDNAPIDQAMEELEEAAREILHPAVRLEREAETMRPGETSRYFLDVDITRHDIVADTPLPALPYWIEDVDGHALRIEPVRAWFTVWSAV